MLKRLFSKKIKCYHFVGEIIASEHDIENGFLENFYGAENIFTENLQKKLLKMKIGDRIDFEVNAKIPGEFLSLDESVECIEMTLDEIISTPEWA